MFDLRNTRYIVFGVANNASICWTIARQLSRFGATVQLVSHPRMESRVNKLAEEAGLPAPLYCDVGIDAHISDCFDKLGNDAPFDGVVHGIAYSEGKELTGRFVDTSRDNFRTTLDISCYSLIEIARRSQALMPDGGSILTLTFDASRGSYPHYNVMGVAKAALEATVNYTATDLGEHKIRVNAIAASPEDTLSARGIKDFRLIGAFAESMSPMGRRATLEEIAHAALFLLSPGASAITGQTLFVDCGASTPRMPPARNARRMASAMASIADAYDQKK